MKHSLQKTLFILATATITTLIPMEPKKDLAQVRAEAKPRLAAINVEVMQEVNDIDIDECANKISEWIDKEYFPFYNDLNSINTILSYENMAEILYAIEKRIPGIPQVQKLFKALCLKNNFVNTITQSLINETKQYIECTNGNTINGIRDENLIHPFNALNSLARWIKRYIMIIAFDDFFADNTIAKFTYHLKDHTDKINFVRLGCLINQIASCSDDSTVRLWNIKTGNCDHILNHVAPVTSCSYNKNQLQLATATKNTDILLWDTHTGKFLYSVKFPVPIKHIAWQKNFLLAADKSHSCYLKNITNQSDETIEFFLPHKNMNLSQYNHWTKTHSIMVVKNTKVVILDINNRGLYLANLAFENSKNDCEKLQKLQTSETITKLSELEGKQIRSKLQTKLNQLALTQK